MTHRAIARRNAICQAAAREGELSIADLEAQLGAAISCEDFGLAATLRDSLKCVSSYACLIEEDLVYPYHVLG